MFIRSEPFKIYPIALLVCYVMNALAYFIAVLTTPENLNSTDPFLHTFKGALDTNAAENKCYGYNEKPDDSENGMISLIGYMLKAVNVGCSTEL